jgi:hypothetical protein
MYNPVLKSSSFSLLRSYVPDLRQVLSRGVLTFIILNEADIILTTLALYLGSTECNVLLASLKSPAMMALGKAGLCLVVVLGLIAFKRQYLFKWINFGMLAVVIWNIVAVISWSI